MATKNTSFWELIDKNKVCIPIIQRDYAQGREKEFEKRERFLNSILRHIVEKEKLHLDFVYGKIKNQVFYPIDGQQRLTTLFLLHWYFALEEMDTEKKAKLIRFVYDTRISSREFCKALVEEIIEIPKKVGEDIFSKEIQKKYWFRATWTNDPTIKAMLVMIQAIHDKFFLIDKASIFKQLTEEKLITFEELDLGAKNFELTDELYIKMNARGKQLTAFENFKANFIQLIDKYFKEKKRNHPIKGEISYSGYFSYKIEKEWTDLFWTFRGDKTIIDNKFSAYFEFVAQMCYFKKYKNAKADDFNNSFSQYEDVFKEENNLLFLFDSLDKLYEVLTNSGIPNKKNLDSFFNSINSNSKIFWNSTDDLNLFERIITNVKNEDPRNKILFYGILHFLIKFKLTNQDESLKKYVRVIRSLMQATRQRNETKYTTNIRINNFGSYWVLFEQLLTVDVYSKLIDNSINNKGTQISDGSLKYEADKAKILLKNINSTNEALIGLEEFEYFEGLIHLLKPEQLNENYPNYLQYIKEIFDNSISSSLKIRALIACDFGGVYIKNCRMGEMWYFGKNHNWSTILTSEDSKVSSSIIQLLNEYSQIEGNPNKKLNSIIDTWLINNQDDRSWKHYFIMYPEFTSKLNYYVKHKDNEIRLLGTEGSNPLVAYHISPFVLTVCKQIDNNSICEAKDCYLQFSGHSPLNLKNGVALTSTQEGWSIEYKTVTLSPEIISKYKLDQKDNLFILREIDIRDRIEIAVDFINDITL